MHTIITPQCQAHNSQDRHAKRLASSLGRYFKAFDLPAAKSLDVCAIIVPFKTEHRIPISGDVHLLTREQNGKITAICEPDPDDTVDVDYEEYRSLTRHVRGTRPADMLIEDLHEVSNKSAWMFIFPNLLLFQAEDIRGEVQTIAPLYVDASTADWARSACGRLRFNFPQSNHQRLKLLADISHAMNIAKNYRTHAINDLQSSGYDIGPVTSDSLGADIDN